MKSNKVLNKIILILTCVGVVIGGAFSFVNFEFKKEMQSPKNWEAFSPLDERFQINFPADPQKNQKELIIANSKIEFQEYSAKVNEVNYAVSYLDFPGTWKLLGTNKLLTKSFVMMLEQEEGVEGVLKQDLSTHQGHSSLDYHFKQVDKVVHGKLVIAGNTLYRITVETPLAAAEKFNPTEFLDSFNIH